MSAVATVRTALERAREELCDLLVEATFVKDTGNKTGAERELAILEEFRDQAMEALRAIRTAELALYDVCSELTGCGPACPSRVREERTVTK